MIELHSEPIIATDEELRKLSQDTLIARVKELEKENERLMDVEQAARALHDRIYLSNNNTRVPPFQTVMLKTPHKVNIPLVAALGRAFDGVTEVRKDSTPEACPPRREEN